MSQSKPILYYWLNKELFSINDTTCYYFLPCFSEKNFLDKNKPLIEYKNINYYLALNPLLNLGFNYDSSLCFTENSRGFLFYGHLKEKIYFFSGFVESQSFFDQYLVEYIKYIKVIPSEGRYKVFKKNGYDYYNSFNYLGFNLHKKVKLILGYYKTFIGFGCRSFIISDCAFQHPTLRVIYKFNNFFTYYASLHFFQSLKNNENNVLKGRNFYKLSLIEFNFKKKFIFSLFQGCIYLPKYRDLYLPNYTFFIPIFGIDLIKYGLDSDNNAKCGILGQFKVYKNLFLYAQTVYDGKYDNKHQYAIQIGLKNSFNLRRFYLFFLVEKNLSSEYAFWKGKSSFIHLNEYIGHSYGNNLNEILFKSVFFYNSFYLEVSFISSKVIPFRRNDIQIYGEKKKNKIKQFELGYYLHKSSYLAFNLGYFERQLENFSKIKFFYFGVKTNVFNLNKYKI